jgi:hypothetical protein
VKSAGTVIISVSCHPKPSLSLMPGRAALTLSVCVHEVMIFCSLHCHSSSCTFVYISFIAVTVNVHVPNVCVTRIGQEENAAVTITALAPVLAAVYAMGRDTVSVAHVCANQITLGLDAIYVLKVCQTFMTYSSYR